MLIYDLIYENLETIMVEAGFKKYRAGQVWSWLYEHQITSFDDMLNIPKEIITFLKEKIYP